MPPVDEEAGGGVQAPFLSKSERRRGDNDECFLRSGHPGSEETAGGASETKRWKGSGGTSPSGDASSWSASTSRAGLAGPLEGLVALAGQRRVADGCLRGGESLTSSRAGLLSRGPARGRLLALAPSISAPFFYRSGTAGRGRRFAFSKTSRGQNI